MGLIRPTRQERAERRQKLMLEQETEEPQARATGTLPNTVRADRKPHGILRQPDPGGNQKQQPDRQGLAHPRPGDISQGHSKPHLTTERTASPQPSKKTSQHIQWNYASRQSTPRNRPGEVKAKEILAEHFETALIQRTKEILNQRLSQEWDEPAQASRTF